MFSKELMNHAGLHPNKHHDDDKFLAPYVLGHRMILKPDAKYSGIKVEDVVEDTLKGVRVPILNEGSIK